MILHFIEIFGWAMLGFTFHALQKIANAKATKPGFSVGTFLKLNIWQYCTSFVAIIAICAFMVQGSIPAGEGIVMFFVGHSGGSAIKNVLKLGSGMYGKLFK